MTFERWHQDVTTLSRKVILRLLNQNTTSFFIQEVSIYIICFLYINGSICIYICVYICQSYVFVSTCTVKVEMCFMFQPTLSKTILVSVVAGTATSHHELQSRPPAQVPTPQGSPRCRPDIWAKENKMKSDS